MIFKVYAGSIFCGILQIESLTRLHVFKHVNGAEILGCCHFGSVVQRVAGYKKLELRRVA